MEFPSSHHSAPLLRKHKQENWKNVPSSEQKESFRAESSGVPCNLRIIMINLLILNLLCTLSPWHITPEEEKMCSFLHSPLLLSHLAFSTPLIIYDAVTLRQQHQRQKVLSFSFPSSAGVTHTSAHIGLIVLSLFLVWFWCFTKISFYVSTLVESSHFRIICSFSALW